MQTIFGGHSWHSVKVVMRRGGETGLIEYGSGREAHVVRRSTQRSSHTIVVDASLANVRVRACCRRTRTVSILHALDTNVGRQVAHRVWRRTVCILRALDADSPGALIKAHVPARVEVARPVATLTANDALRTAVRKAEGEGWIDAGVIEETLNAFSGRRHANVQRRDGARRVRAWGVIREHYVDCDQFLQQLPKKKGRSHVAE